MINFLILRIIRFISHPVNEDRTLFQKNNNSLTVDLRIENINKKFIHS